MSLRQRAIENDLAEMKLNESRRSVVYNFGAAEGLVLEAADLGWRERYFQERFSPDRHFPFRR